MIALAARYWKAIVAAMLVAIIVALALQNAGLKTEIATAKKDYVEREAALNKEVADRRQELANIKHQHAIDQQRNDDEFNARKAQDAKRLADLSAINNRLRHTLAQYTGDDRRAGETDAALIERHRDRLKILGTMVERGADLLERGFGLVQQRDREVDLLLHQITVDRQACQR